MEKEKITKTDEETITNNMDNNKENTKPYMVDYESIIEKLDSHKDMGINHYEARARLEIYGPNSDELALNYSLVKTFFLQFINILNLLSIITGCILFYESRLKESLLVFAITILKILISTYRNLKYNKLSDSLGKPMAKKARVIREGKLNIIPVSQVVPGDIIPLDQGDIVPADLRLISAYDLKLKEVFGGEDFISPYKNPYLILDKEEPLEARLNMAYRSSIVIKGRGSGIVIGTGSSKEDIEESLEEEISPLEKKTKNLGILLIVLNTLACLGVSYLGYINNINLLDLLILSLVLIITTTPLGLRPTLNNFLVTCMDKMSNINIIIKKPRHIENLGLTSLISFSKTGVLSQNKMLALNMYVDNKNIEVTGSGYEPFGDFIINHEKIDISKIGDLETLLSAAALVNNARLESGFGEYYIMGDPTEGGLVSLATKAGFSKKKLDKKYKKLSYLPFDSDRMMMTSFHQDYLPNRIISFTKGSPEQIIKRSSKISFGGRVVNFTEELKEEVLEKYKNLSSSQLRVLGFSYKDYPSMPKNISTDIQENNMTFIGLIGLNDPAKPQVREDINRYNQAGIRVVLITGEGRETAFSLAKDLNIYQEDKDSLPAIDLSNIKDSDLDNLTSKVNTYARVSSHDKKRLIESFKNQGQVVALVGRKVTDIPALKKADISIAMGVSGVDAVKETSDIVLLDDNVSSIFTAIEESRNTYENFKKYIVFLISCNIGEIILIGGSIYLKVHLPLNIGHLLLLGLIKFTLPSLVLAGEDPDMETANKPPRDINQPILKPSDLALVIIQGLAIAGSALTAFKYGLDRYPNSLPTARTMVFATIFILELLRIFSSRSEKYTAFEIGIFSNGLLIKGVILTIIGLIIAIYLPSLGKFLNLYPLRIQDFKVIIPLAFIPLILEEFLKLFKK